jgi:hypothetical protein
MEDFVRYVWERLIDFLTHAWGFYAEILSTAWGRWWAAAVLGLCLGLLLFWAFSLGRGR